MSESNDRRNNKLHAIVTKNNFRLSQTDVTRILEIVEVTIGVETFL